MDGLFVGGNLDALDLFEFLDAALHLLGFCRLGAEAIDERFELFDLSRWLAYAASSCARRSVFCSSYFE